MELNHDVLPTNNLVLKDQEDVFIIILMILLDITAMERNQANSEIFHPYP
jgi:hypothetical protein